MQPDDRLDLGTLADWIEGRLDDAAAARVAAAARAGDARVLAGLDWLRGFASDAQQPALEQPPPIVGQELRQQFGRWTAARKTLTPAVQKHRAILVFDSRKDLASSGMRSSDQDDDPFHLAYECDAGDVVLDETPTGPGRLGLDGQVLLADPGSAPIFRVSVTGGGISMSAIDGDELGWFHVEDVPDQAVELRLGNGLIEIVAPLDVRDRP